MVAGLQQANNNNGNEMAGSSGSTNRDQSSVFLDDDEETLRILCLETSNEAVNADLPAQLDGAARRFLQDHHPSVVVQRLGDDNAAGAGNQQDAWETWETIVESQLDIKIGQTSGIAPLPRPAVGDLPMAFASESGTIHLNATMALLQVSRFEAGQITLSYMRSVSTSEKDDRKQFHSLLGTFTLLDKVMDHCYHQRIARWAIIAECLRAEQDKEATHQPTMTRILDSLDEIYKEEGMNRGLLRMILSATCQTNVSLSYAQLEPAKQLRAAAPSTLLTTQANSDAAWRRFASNAVEKKRSFSESERLQAMEALLALLYSRIQDGVSRKDLALILVAFQYTKCFFTGFGEGSERLARLAGLACVECMGLWRIQSGISEDAAQGGLWVRSHPLFRGILQNEMSAQREITSLLSVMQDLSKQASDRRDTVLLERPEGLVLLSFGVLLKTAYSNILHSPEGGASGAFWQTFDGKGMELFTLANDECDAFDSIHHVVSTLIEAPEPTLSECENFGPYELNESKGPEKDSQSVAELSPPSLLYANISRELLAAVIAAFEGTILSLNHSEASVNIGMICGLVSLTFRNSPTLCETFWDELAFYNPEEASQFPFCYLLDAAFMLAKTSIESTFPLNESVIRGASPLLRLVSSLVYDAQSSESALTTAVPNGLIPSVLMIASQSNTIAPAVCVSVLESLSTWTRVGNSSSFRKALREQLEDSAVIQDFDLAHVMVNISHNEASTDYARYAFSILSSLLTDAPEATVVNVAATLGSSLEKFWQGLFGKHDGSMLAAVSLIQTMMTRVETVCRSEQIPEEHVISFLSFIGHGARACCNTLSFALSSPSSKLLQQSMASDREALSLLDCLRGVLESVCPIMEFSRSERIKIAATELIENCLINHLAMSTGLIDTIMYYATAPVSLGLLNSLDDLIRDSDVLTAISAQDSEKNLSLSRMELSTGMGIYSETQMAMWKQHLIGSMRKAYHLSFDDFDDMHVKGWITDGVATVLQTCLAALRLLIAWAKGVDGMLVGASDDSFLGLLSLSPNRFLARASILPPPCRAGNALSRVWLASGVSYSTLIIILLTSSDKSDVSMSIQTAALDFIYISLVHFQASSGCGSPQDLPLLADFRFSKAVTKVMEEQITILRRLSKTSQWSSKDKSDCCISLRYLRLLELCIELSPSVALQLLGEDACDSFRELCSLVTDAPQSLAPASDRMRIACVCLAVVHALWLHARGRASSVLYGDDTSETMKKMADGQIQLLNYLARFALDLATPQFSEDSESKALAACSIKCFKSLALQILTLEMAWAHDCNEDLSQDTPILRALDGALGQDLSRFVAATQQYSEIRSFGIISANFLEAAEDPKKISENDEARRILLHILSPSARFRSDAFTDCSGPNTVALGIRNESSKLSQHMTLRNLVVTSNDLKCEVKRLSAWKNFATTFSLLSEKRRRLSSALSFQLLPDNAFMLGVVEAISKSLLRNLGYIKEAPLLNLPFILVTEGVKVAGFSAGILLCFIAECDTESTLAIGDWINVLTMLSDCASKISSVLGSYSMVSRLHDMS